jgi:hypothetical protein
MLGAFVRRSSAGSFSHNLQESDQSKVQFAIGIEVGALAGLP